MDKSVVPGNGRKGAFTLSGSHSKTLLITNLPPDVTIKTLLDRIAGAGPFGKLYSAHLDKQNPFDPNCRPIPYATLAFFRDEDTRSLRNYINDLGLHLHGYTLHAEFTQSKPIPERDDPNQDPHPNPSRVILVTGPKYLLTRANLITKLEQNDLVPFHRVMEIQDTPLERKFVVLFTSYSMAKRAMSVVKSRKNEVTTVYARDPIEIGVKVVADSNKEHGVVVQFSNWIVNENTDQQRATDAGSGEPEDNQDDHRIAEVPRWAASPVGAQYWTVEDTETDGNHVEELGQGIGHGADGNSIPPDLAAGTERVKVKTGRRLFSAFWPQARGQGGCIVM